jgi:hypothetical protein
MVSVPNDQQIIVNAVQKYEIYLKDLKQKLHTALVDQISDYKIADNLTEQIFAEYGLPDVY